MTPEQFKRLDQLFNQARDLTSEQRHELLESVRQEDASLADYLDDMLNETVHDPALAIVHQAALEEMDNDPTIGQRLGPWEVIEIIGRGGMGAVYRATRPLGDLTQQVAIKKIRLGMDDPVVRSRFLRERQILAKLDHPGLARLIDGGTDEQGTPYVVMDFVDGQPITQYCREASLSVSQRVQLFIDLCRTVHFVHRNLIIHRDIKPANVMVNREGSVKLLDFGIAKLLDPQDPDVTATAQRALTPEYASPEQLLGDTVSTASDVFSLGALLYELLTGHLIIGEHSSDSRRGSRLMLDRTPTAPSHLDTANTRTGVMLQHQIGTDLDKIVMMALRTEPHRRYGSAEALAEDLERYLKQRPVQAQHDSLRYRSRMFVRRNRWAVTAFSLALLSALILAVISIRQAQVVSEERDRAVAAEKSALREAETSNQISQFLIRLFGASNPRESGNQFLTARDLLDTGLEQLKQGAHIDSDSDSDAIVTDPAVRAELFLTMGLAYTALNVGPPSVDAMYQALLETERAYGPEHINTAEIYNRYGDVLREADRTDEAEPWLMKSLEMKIRLLGNDSPLVADSHNNIGIMLVDQGRLDEALIHQNLAVETWRRAVGADSDRMAVPVYNLGLLYRRMGRFEEALSAADEAARTSQNRPDLHAKLDMLRARLYRQLGQPERTLALFRETLRWAIEAYGQYQGMALTIGREIASTLSVLGRYDEADAMFGELQADARADPVDWFYWQFNRGSMLSERGQHPEAIDHLQPALDTLIESGARSHLLPPIRFALAKSLHAMGQTNAALEQVDAGLLHIADHSQLQSHAAGLLLLKAQIQLSLEQGAPIQPLIDQALAQLAASRSDDSPEAALVWLSISQLHERTGEPGKQVQAARQALALLQDQLPADHWKIAEARRLSQMIGDG